MAISSSSRLRVSIRPSGAPSTTGKRAELFLSSSRHQGRASSVGARPSARPRRTRVWPSIVAAGCVSLSVGRAPRQRGVEAGRSTTAVAWVWLSVWRAVNSEESSWPLWRSAAAACASEEAASMVRVSSGRAGNEEMAEGWCRVARGDRGWWTRGEDATDRQTDRQTTDDRHQPQAR